MELNKNEIKKIAKKFKIPQKKLENFLIEEERKLEITSVKQLWKTENSQEKKVAILQKWKSLCQKFNEFEELYILVPLSLLDQDFFINWMYSTKDYIERKTVYSCIINDKTLRAKVIEIWVQKASSIDDVREAISHTNKDSKEYAFGIKKILQFYKE